MLRRALPLLLLPLLAACGGRVAPELTAEQAFARLPDEIGGFRKARPETPGRTVIARYAHPNRAAASVLALPAGRSDAEAEREVASAVDVFARATVADASSRRENATLRHFGARAGEAGPVARCLDVQLRGDIPRRQLGCASLLERRVFMVTMVAPESADGRAGARDPLLAVTMRLIGALSGAPPEPMPVAASSEAEPSPAPAVARPRAPAPRPRPRVPASGPAWRV